MPGSSRLAAPALGFMWLSSLACATEPADPALSPSREAMSSTPGSGASSADESGGPSSVGAGPSSAGPGGSESASPEAAPGGSSSDSADGALAGNGAAAASAPTDSKLEAAAPPASMNGATVFSAGARPRVMIVGDSISAGPGCYKGFLVENLAASGYSDFEFVGQYSDDCGAGVRHSAVSCSTAQQYTQASFSLPDCFPGTTFPGLSALAATHQPDLMLLQLGVNDVWGGRAIEAILNDYDELVLQARAQNPSIVLVVAQIQQIRPSCDPADDSVFGRARALVEAVPAWAESVSTEQSPVFVADLWTNSDWSMAETLDCVHPNDVGAERMGLNWFNALRGILSPD